MRTRRLGFTTLIVSTLAQNVPDQLNLTSTLTQHEELSSFSSILSQYPQIWDLVTLGNVTVLAPSNDALAEYFNTSDSNINSTQASAFPEALLTYHILGGDHSRNDLQKSTQFIPTMLTNTSYANITGGQRVEARSSDTQVYILSGVKARSNIIMADILYAGSSDLYLGIIHVIDKVLTIPLNEINTVSEAQLNGFAQVLSDVPPDPRIYGVLGGESDWTLFAPNHSQYPISNMTVSQQYDLETYAFVRGTVKYSTDLTDGLSLQTVEGKNVTVTLLNGSIYINAAKIIDPDYLLNTGVLHLMDRVINPNNTSERPTTATPTTTNITPSSSSPAPTKHASSTLSTASKAGIGVGAAAGGLLVIALICFFLFRSQARKRNSQPGKGKEKHPGLSGETGTETRAGIVGGGGGGKNDAKELQGKEKGRRVELEAKDAPRIYEVA